VKINPKFLRPATNTVLVGDTSRARNAFGFDPKVKFKELVKLMVEADLEDLQKNAQPK